MGSMTTSYRCKIPKNLLLQLHITERCNMQCKHCYQGLCKNNSEISFDNIVNIINQFVNLLEECDKINERRTIGHITITGGEPLFRDDFLDIVDLLYEYKQRFTFAILTNGTLVDNKIANYLSRLQPRFIQVSIDGIQTTHDRLRGDGHFEQACSGLKYLVKNKVKTMVSFTANRKNFTEFSKVVEISRDLGVNFVWADRIVPIGLGNSKEFILRPNETREFIKLVTKESMKYYGQYFSKFRVLAHRALQFLEGGNQIPYSCKAGFSLITILANGDLVPCRRMPIIAGNVLTDELSNIFWRSNILKQIQQQNNRIVGCEKCKYTTQCKGGLRCLSYAIYGNGLYPDPGCWIATKECIALEQMVG